MTNKIKFKITRGMHTRGMKLGRNVSEEYRGFPGYFRLKMYDFREQRISNTARSGRIRQS